MTMAANQAGLDVVDWVLEGQDRGVGEILLTSVDRDGTKRTRYSACPCGWERLRIPLIASGGIGTPQLRGRNLRGWSRCCRDSDLSYRTVKRGYPRVLRRTQHKNQKNSARQLA